MRVGGTVEARCVRAIANASRAPDCSDRDAQECPHKDTKTAGGWCMLDGPDAQFYDATLANATAHALTLAVSCQRRARDHATGGRGGGGGDGASAAADAPIARPFMVMAGFVRPHVPWMVPTRVWDLYEESPVRLPHGARLDASVPNVSWSPSTLVQPPSRLVNPTGRASGAARRVPGGVAGRFVEWTSARHDVPVAPDAVALEARRAYYAAVTFVDEQAGASRATRVVAARMAVARMAVGRSG